MQFSAFTGVAGSHDTTPQDIRRKQMMAQMLMQGSNTPALTKGAGIAEALQKGIAGWMAGSAMHEAGQRETAKADTMRQAMDAGMGSPSGLDPKTGITWDTARPGDSQMMARILMGNQDTAPTGMQMAYGDMQQGKQFAREDAVRKDTQGFQTGERVAAQGFQAGQQERGFGHAERMQGGQQAFTAGENRLGREHQTGLQGQQQAFTADQNALGRQQQTDLQGNQQTFTAGQNDLTRAHQTGLQGQQQGFTAEENEKNRQLQINLKNTEQKVATAKTTFDRENTLRDEFNTLSKDHRVVQDAYTKIQKSAASKTGPGDMSMLYSYIKLLDPNSAVREGEYATATTAASIPESIRRIYNKAIDGQLMPEELRTKFLGEAQNIYSSQMQGYDTLIKNYSALANKYSIDPTNVIQDYRKAGGQQGAGVPAPPAGFQVIN